MSTLFPLEVIEPPRKLNKQKRKDDPAPQTSQEQIEAELLTADLILINSSAGKDSQTALEEVVRIADRLRIPRSRLIVVHADLGAAEWPGTRELAQEQAHHYGLRFEVTQYRSEKGEPLTLLEHIIRRGRWPDPNNRYCTSDMKRGPVMRVMTEYARRMGWGSSKLRPGQRRMKIVNVLGMRAEESDARRLLPNWTFNSMASNGKREVFNWLPIFRLRVSEVWERIRASGVRHHWAYDLGMPRLSCCFCIFSPRSALILAGRHNLPLLRQYAAAERLMGHRFRQDVSLVEILAAVEAGEQPGLLTDWEM